MNALLGLIIGALVGYVVSLLLLMFFEDEVFDFFDRLRARVRKLCGLRP